MEDAQLGEMIGRLRKMPIPPQITFFDVGAEVKDNVAVESLDFSRLMVGVGQKIQIRANIRNFGDVPYPELRVYFKVDGTEISASQIRLGPYEKGQVLFSHAFQSAGSHVIEVVADADALKAVPAAAFSPAFPCATRCRSSSSTATPVPSRSRVRPTSRKSRSNPTARAAWNWPISSPRR